MYDSGQKGAFSIWIRTGRWPDRQGVPRIEIKYNPWHDPRDGRFTFAGMGRHDGSWSGGGFTGGGGGDFAGGGASSDEPWGPPTKPMRRPVAKPVDLDPVTRARNAAAFLRAVRSQPLSLADAPKPFRHVLKNGYDFQIDDLNRTRKVAGDVALAESNSRSRTTQTRAGHPDRRPTDDGGHYIAARFNGPREAFNHFAQDANFNRGAYRELEKAWATAKARGDRVFVDIIPEYRASSQRPTTIEVIYRINGKLSRKRFANEHQGNTNGRR